MAEHDGELLQIKHVNSDKATRFRVLAVTHKLSQAEVFELLFDHAFELVSMQLKEEKEERKEREKKCHDAWPAQA